MIIQIGQLKLFDVTLDEIDDLVKRYGNRTTNGIVSRRDYVLLREFVETGDTGISSKRLVFLLGKNRKTMRAEARKWAFRVGLTDKADDDPFCPCRLGTVRAIRIKDEFYSRANNLL